LLARKYPRRYLSANYPSNVNFLRPQPSLLDVALVTEEQRQL
jgi:hypothetical protein